MGWWPEVVGLGGRLVRYTELGGQGSKLGPREDAPQLSETGLGTSWLVVPWVGLGLVGWVTGQAK